MRRQSPTASQPESTRYDARRCVRAVSMSSLNTISSAGHSEMNSSPKREPFPPPDGRLADFDGHRHIAVSNVQA